ncbi:peptide ABC transporter [Defluviimonas sp. 20V17]|uniref:ABC transporter substrate-binding protein n=1 Tax=Allgaiera indica TaxID=765699 RepID=A0AAN4UPX9_9RHOB|nr:peptide ABC transporter substrate-binding protein [Allgaiera indica]KDB03285.1 peptide ABC transporter [Defluviimonas sp. 20V17]GHE00599.1 ABC transporter substrate-binding protein [Allgaiera indica]SDW59114.1 peptide/nickel transport system substrate-binding protein [Allgaiera indica]
MKIKLALMGAAAALALAPVAHAEGRGADGTVNIIYWQAPSILNPYLSGGTKDVESSSIVLEPLAGYDQDGKLFPRLAADIPTVANGGISKDLKSITWHLKKGLKWSDGSPVTAADVVFTGKYCMDPQGGCAQLSHFEGVKSIEEVDPLTVKITFKEPQPVPYGPFVSSESPILQKKQFENCMGAKAPTCTEANFNPIGTGPFEVTEFKPNDVIQFKANPNYRVPDEPHFAKVNFKGGGSAMASARAVLQTGEYDYGWNLQLSPKVLEDMTKDGKGKLMIGFGTLVERLQLNLTDPSSSLPADERSTAKRPNPFLSDKRVREALSMALDRNVLTQIGYGKMGKPTCNWIPAPANFADANNTSCLKQNIAGAKKLLDEAGWKMGSDGYRHKDGKKLVLSYQTSTNAVRQQFQAIIKQWWKEIGVDTELKNINASVFFGGDPGSPDTFQKFYADVEMYANNFNGADPGAYVAQYTCDKAPRPATQWQGENITRFCSKKYDELVAELGKTANYEKRGEIVKKLNAILTVGQPDSTYTMLPLVWRGRVSAASNTLGGDIMNTWDSEMWNIQSWYRKK